MAGNLNARKVETLSKPGRYSDGGNLYLFISSNGGKRWTFFYRFGKTAEGKPIRREMGLGSAAKGQVSLAEARERAVDARKLLNARLTPWRIRSAPRRPRGPYRPSGPLPMTTSTATSPSSGIPSTLRNGK